MVGTSIELTGKSEALKALDGVADRAQNARGMWETIGLSLVTSTQRRISDTNIAPDGSPWPPSLRVIAHGGKTLRLSGRLERSITEQASDRGVEVGTNVIYAAIHQFSGDIAVPARDQALHFKTDKKSGQQRFSRASKATRSTTAHIPAHTVHMPLRSFLGLDDDDTREIPLIVDDWLSSGGTVQ